MTKQYSTVYMYHVFFIHSSVNEHLDCLHVLVIVNSAAMNIGMAFMYFSLDICSVVRLLDHMEAAFLIF